MALLSSVTTKVTTSYNATEIIQVLTGDGTHTGVGDLLFFQDLPFGSAHLVLTSGAAPTGIQYMVANDGILTAGTPPLVLTNPVNLGPAATLVANSGGQPANMIDLATGTIAAAGPSSAGFTNLAQTPYKYGQFLVTGAGAAFVVTINIILMGTRG